MNDESDPFGPLSEEEKEFVEQDVEERSERYDGVPAGALPDAPINADHVEGLDLPPLTPGEQAIVQHDVDEQLGQDAPVTGDDSQGG